MSLSRILKTGGSLMSSQGINVLTQFLLPPIFLHRYGVAGYGEWLTLTAAVGYLSALNFGLHTFTNNQVAICYNRGELEEAKTLQATAMLLIVCIMFAAAILTSIVFLLPVNVWLGIKLSRGVVDATIYLLGLQLLVKLLMALIVGSFLVIGVSYRGSNWNNAAYLAITIATAGMAFMRCSFAWIAAQQAVILAVICALAMNDLRRNAPLLVPRLRYARPSRALEILKQSGYFGLIFWSNFFVFQLPLILMQRILGPSSVVAFSITRTIYSMSRQALTAMTQSLGQEVTELYGQHQWARLFRLYELSERVVFAMIPAVTLGTLLATPVLITVWLHKPSLYDPYMCIVMALISAAMGIKEHKYQFQVSTNQHTMLARITFWSYLGMAVLGATGIYMFGPMGFLVPWLFAEVLQTILILRLNQRLFGGTSQLEFSPVYKLFALMGVAVLLASWFAIHAQQRSLIQASMTAVAFALVLTCISYPLFQLSDVRIYLRDRMALRSQIGR
jgi:O-antigen/teichoic acid export membrane protein